MLQIFIIQLRLGVAALFEAEIVSLSSATDGALSVSPLLSRFTLRQSPINSDSTEDSLEGPLSDSDV